MVGATRWFIAKPMNIRAVINGAISGLMAIGLVIAGYCYCRKNIAGNESDT